jgi:hypothetical protein
VHVLVGGRASYAQDTPSSCCSPRSFLARPLTRSLGCGGLQTLPDCHVANESNFALLPASCHIAIRAKRSPSHYPNYLKNGEHAAVPAKHQQLAAGCVKQLRASAVGRLADRAGNGGDLGAARVLRAWWARHHSGAKNFDSDRLKPSCSDGREARGSLRQHTQGLAEGFGALQYLTTVR